MVLDNSQWEGSPPPVVLQLFLAEKFLENLLKILISDPHLQESDSEGMWQNKNKTYF